VTGVLVSTTRRLVATLAAACIMGGWPAGAVAQQSKPGAVEEYEEIYVQAFATMDHPGPFDASGRAT
jgi:hypothetical protein